MNNIVKLALAALLSTILLGCEAHQNPDQARLKQSDSGVSATLKSRAIAVEINDFAKLSVPLQHSASATALGNNNSTIKAEINARIDKIHVDVGSKVAKGALLISLNCTDAKAHLRQAKALHHGAQARAEASAQELERNRKLIQKHAVSAAQFSQREAEYASALSEAQANAAALALATNQVARCSIRAPFAGMVSQRMAQLGELASYGMPMLQLVSTNDIVISAHIQPDQAHSLQQADKIKFVSGSAAYKLKLDTIVATLNSSTKNREARLHLQDIGSVLAGTPGRIEWQDMQQALPARFTTERDGVIGAFIVVDHHYQFIALPQAQAGRPVTVDWPGTTQVVSAGFNSVIDGQALSADKEH